MSTILDFAGMFDAYVGTQEKVWKYDRKRTLGASEAFGCIRKAWFEKNDAVKDDDYEDKWGATHRGDLIENHLVVPAVLYGLKRQAPKAKLLGAGSDQTTILDRRRLNSATPDGLITGLSKDALKNYGIDDIEGDCILLEIKSIDPRVNLQQEKTIHAGQCQQQLGIVRQRTKFKPMYAVIVYVDASFHDNIRVFTIRYDERKWEAAQKRAELLFKTTDPGLLRPEGKFDDSCKYCPFTRVCSAATIGSIPPKSSDRDTMQQPEDSVLRELVVEHERLRAEKDKATADYESKRQEIKEHLATTKKRGERHSGWSVNWFSQGGKKKLDEERLKEDLGVDSLDDYKTEGSGFDKLVIQVKEDLG